MGYYIARVVVDVRGRKENVSKTLVCETPCETPAGSFLILFCWLTCVSTKGEGRLAILTKQHWGRGRSLSPCSPTAHPHGYAHMRVNVSLEDDQHLDHPGAVLQRAERLADHRPHSWGRGGLHSMARLRI